MQTLPKNIADNQDCIDNKFLVLDYNSQDDLAEYISTVHKADIKNGTLVYYKFPDAEKFHMAHAKNMAHRCGLLEGADVLVNVDADSYTGLGFANWLAENFISDKIFFQAMWNRWVETENGEVFLAQAPDGTFEPPVPKGSNGRMAVTKNAFLKAGGYNEKFNTWGPDDKDFNIRLRRLGYEPQLLDRKFLETILHNDKIRFKEYPEVKNTKGYNFNITVGDSDEIIANYGKVGMGTVYKNFRNDPIVLGPIPTRIFGIGLHKTGTTSLNNAFKILGFDSGHWENAHWAKEIWRNINNYGYSNKMERFYALSDLPIPLLYAQLDKAYPGSKFILTIRPEADWIASVEKHWSNNNSFKHQWHNDPFTNRIHTVLYGQANFNKEVFLKRYQRFNAEVREYFKDRPEDLLVMDISQRYKWPKLCYFLNLPIPMVDYPKSYTSPLWEPDYQI